jgi:hypothetical protein
MKAAIERQVANSIILHKDIDQTRHAISVQNGNLKLITREVVNNSNRLRNVDNSLAEFETYLELETMFDSIGDIIESIEDIKRDARLSRCNEKGVSPDFLISHLCSFESNKAGFAPVFASWEWQKYYNYNLCTLALHDNEIWITMRIPIVNLAEQLVRVIPPSSHLWIKQKTSGLGIDSTLFAYRKVDTFMLMTNANLELCFKMMSVRVCSMRKTKYRETDPFVVPLDIGHNRAIILTNNTNRNVSIKTICGANVNSESMKDESILTIPEKCAVLSKTFEISKIGGSHDSSNVVEFSQIDKFVLRSMQTGQKSIVLKNLNLTKDKKDTIEINNNATLDELSNIKLDDVATKDALIIATSSTSMILISGVAIILVILLIKRYCGSRQQRSDEKVVFMIIRPRKNSVRETDRESDDIGEKDRRDTSNTSSNIESNSFKQY